MISKNRAVASLLLAAGILVHAKEATYLDSAFEVNTPGYLYNLGTRKYIGLEPRGKLDLMAVENPKKALRLRGYYSTKQGVGGIFFVHDVPSMSKLGANEELSLHDLDSRKTFQKCPDNSPKKVIFTFFSGNRNSFFLFSPPMLLNENAFQINSGKECLTVNSATDALLAEQCRVYPNKERNYQMFVWVNANTYNRGVDPITFLPNPYLDNSNPMTKEQMAKECKRYKVSCGKNPAIHSPSNIGIKKPYYPEYTEGEKPPYCIEYLNQFSS